MEPWNLRLQTMRLISTLFDSKTCIVKFQHVFRLFLMRNWWNFSVDWRCLLYKLWVLSSEVLRCEPQGWPRWVSFCRWGRLYHVPASCYSEEIQTTKESLSNNDKATNIQKTCMETWSNQFAKHVKPRDLICRQTWWDLRPQLRFSLPDISLTSTSILSFVLIL